MIIHDFNDSRFPQSDKDQTIAGVNIPKGYVNASLMCRNYGKQIKIFMKQKSTKEYIVALEKDINKVRFFYGTAQETTETTEETTKTKEGWISSAISLTEKNKVSNEYRGVWMHPELAIELAGWLSVDFKVWANRVLRLVIEDKVQTIEFDDAQRKLQWEYLRTQSKANRRKFTDCLAEHIILTKGEAYYHSPASSDIFAKYTAIAQRELTGIPSFNGNRDNCTQEQLTLLENFELAFATKFLIDYPDETFDEIFNKVIRKIKSRL